MSIEIALIVIYLVIAAWVAYRASHQLAWGFYQSDLNSDHSETKKRAEERGIPDGYDYSGGSFLGIIAGVSWPIWIFGVMHRVRDSKIMHQKKENEQREKDLEELGQELENDFDRRIQEAVDSAATRLTIPR